MTPPATLALSIPPLAEEPGLRIRPVKRSHPEATDHWDGNWLACVVAVRGALAREVAVDLRTNELRAFRNELQALADDPSRTATFDTMEQWLEIEIVANDRGRLSAKCAVSSAPGMGSAVRFTLELEHADLAEMTRQLDAIVAAYPVVG